MERISESTVRRFSTYVRVLDDYSIEEKLLISSRELATLSGVTAAQVRKDLSCLGSLGRRGLGYMVEPLRVEIRSILGLSRRWLLALVGAGNIGTALVSYQDFADQGFQIVAVFDNSPERIGCRLGELTVEPMGRFPELWSEREVEIGVIATPARDAQEIADVMVTAGLRGVLNFAPRAIRLPDHVAHRAVSMTRELESLSFMLNRIDHNAGPRRFSIPD